MVVWWLFEVLPLGVTSFLPVVLFPIMGIVPGIQVSLMHPQPLFPSDKPEPLSSSREARALSACQLCLTVSVLLVMCVVCQICGMYLSDQVLILFGSCMLATAVEEYDLHRRLALAILRRTGDSPYRLVLGTAPHTHN